MILAHMLFLGDLTRGSPAFKYRPVCVRRGRQHMRLVDGHCAVPADTMGEASIA